MNNWFLGMNGERENDPSFEIGDVQNVEPLKEVCEWFWDRIGRGFYTEDIVSIDFYESYIRLEFKLDDHISGYHTIQDIPNDVFFSDANLGKWVSEENTRIEEERKIQEIASKKAQKKKNKRVRKSTYLKLKKEFEGE